jgi:hypothetical protein
LMLMGLDSDDRVVMERVWTKATARFRRA